MDIVKDGESQLDGTRTNEEILQMVDKKRSPIGRIRSQQRKWLGHKPSHNEGRLPLKNYN